MNKELTEIVFILDESGSMSPVKDDTIGGFNQFVEDQKKLPGFADFTLVKFSDYYKVINEGVDIVNIPDLDRNSYTPSFSTALLDAVGKTIELVKKRLEKVTEGNKPGKVLFAILTDGEENASREYTTSKIQDLVKEARDKNGWEFLFLGADIDAWSGGSSMGITSNVRVSKSNMKMSMKGMSNYAAMYRSAGTTDVETFNMSEEDLDAQMKDLQNKP
jgi:uncharacterized protein YegL